MRFCATLLLLVAPLAFGCITKGTSTLSPGSWRLEGRETLGELRVDGDGPRLHLYGTGWCVTEGRVVVEASREAVEGARSSIWAWVPVTSGLGAGELAVEIRQAEAVLLVPLGARKGEHELRLAMKPGVLSEKEREEGRARCGESLERLRAAWAEGAFKVLDEGNALAGSLRLSAASEPVLHLFHETMATDGPQAARQRVEGPDLVLTFPVEPSYRGEPGEIRVNVPTGRVVIPAGPEPTPLDRWWRITPGVVSEAETEARWLQATRISILREKESLGQLGQSLAREASARRKGAPRCPDFDAMGPDWARLLGDYEVTLLPRGKGCEVRLQPASVQHTRRLQAAFDEGGLLNAEPLGVPGALSNLER